jgi:hypothetical protein
MWYAQQSSGDGVALLIDAKSIAARSHIEKAYLVFGTSL